jgi:hypothetical protein
MAEFQAFGGTERLLINEQDKEEYRVYLSEKC